MLEPVDIAATVVAGVAFDPKNGERVARMDLNELYASVGRLFDLLEGRRIDYALVGGIALLSYVEGRNTQDVDLLIPSSELARLPELRVEERDERFARAWLGDLRVDLLFAEVEPFRTVLAEHVTRRAFAGRDAPTVTPDGLLLLKLFALPSLYRQGRFDRITVYRGDLVSLLRRGTGPSDACWESLSKVLLDTDIEELRKIVADLRRSIEDETRPFSA